MPHRAPLPTEQHAYPGLPALSAEQLHRRREGLFLLLSGLFLGTLTMLNILGVTRFLKLLEIDFDGDPSTPATVFAVAVGVLPYPLTFLCTDFISELYGRARASAVVWVGLVLNLWVVFILWLGGLLPGFEAADPVTGKVAADAAGRLPVFFEVRDAARGAVAASMVAYLLAQLVDVHLFHFWKGLTKGKLLWLRNNASTLVSQLVDSATVILVTYFFTVQLDGVVKADHPLWPQLFALIATGYVFKVLCAAVDTVPFYLGTARLCRHLRLPQPGVCSNTGQPAIV